MRRTRIKAMVTVPTRRKATQEVSVTETDNSNQQNEKCENVSDDICITNSSQQFSENKSLEEKTEESVEINKQVENDNSISNCNTHKDTSVLNSEDPKETNVQSLETSCNTHKDTPVLNSEDTKETNVQSLEKPNTIEINSVKLTPSRCSFVKPVPKFNSRVRRNSTQGSGASASESEDDNRKVSSTVINCTKNDVTQSTQNAKDTTANSAKNNFKTSCVGQKRRIVVSESARKLAEARREFHLKHEHKTHDRSKLTMYDLIYYNPITNPMKNAMEKLKESTTTTTTTTKTITECQTEREELEEEKEDDPSSAMPVPQVKVGPNGELIIDEQSLVIEHSDAKKNTEILAKEAIIIDDTYGNGFYKRRKKTKDWSKWETLKFYKALNTVGTDFLLMQSLFPNRTRQEMKLKFKKEERVNRNLVEKALVYHQEFDTDQLKESLDTFESLEKEYSNPQLKRKQQSTKDRKKTKYSKRRKCRIVASSIGEIDESDKEEEKEEEQNDEFDEGSTDQLLNKENNKIHKKSKESKLPSVETDDIESVSSYNDVDSDTEIYRVRPTRSGRLPKVNKLRGPDINSLDNERLNCSSNDEIAVSPTENAKSIDSIILNNTSVTSETDNTTPFKEIIPNMTDVEPGSLVILSKESLDEPGKSVLQVYMVSSDVVSEDLKKSSDTPVSTDVLATVSTEIADGESVEK